jgi:phospholipase C
MMQTLRQTLLTYVSLIAVTAQALAPAAAAAAPQQPNDNNTTTPIKHVIAIYGENRSFDHLFATYKPRGNETVNNLLSEGIVNADGTPGPNFAKAAQYKATTTATYSISPAKTGAYDTLPPPLAGGPQTRSDTDVPFRTIAEAEDADGALLPRDLRLLTTGATGLPSGSVDTRINNVDKLPNGPFQLSPGVSVNDYAQSPVHRFYQDWQQHDCNANYATETNPTGCLTDLFPWVETTVGAGSNGKAQAANFTDATTGEGSTAMGFYNMQQGDAAYTKQLADNYTISDNYHQPAKGGSELNDVVALFADGIWYTDGRGKAATPPVDQIENPDPASGTNNWYSQDGYSGGTYSECSDTSHSGVVAVAAYLNSLPTKVNLNCEPGHYYMLNNLNPGYLANGELNTTTFTIPPVPTHSIGDVLLDSGVSFTYFNEGLDQAIQTGGSAGSDAFEFQSRFMADATLRTQANKDLNDFEADVHSGNLPAVSFIKPSGLNDGHPNSSKWSLYEAFVRKIITELKQNPDLWASTAVFITVDEGGGYYDSGYTQNLDFFGDGVRIPLIVVSPYARGGHVSHNYADHVSILKFIEKNWGLSPISPRSRDNLPNPVAAATSPYVPVNGPSISDLMDMFNFHSAGTP